MTAPREGSMIALAKQCSQCRSFLHQAPQCPGVWVTKQGEEVPVVDLESGHLVNIIKYCRRNARKWQTSHENAAWEAFLTLNGEEASYAAQQEVENLAGMTEEEYLDYRFEGRLATWDGLLMEVESRGMDPDNPVPPPVIDEPGLVLEPVATAQQRGWWNP